MSAPGPASLVLCTRDRPQLLLETVQSILAGDRLPDELVVMDQSDAPHPTLSTMAAPAGCEIRYFHLPSRGLCRAREEGVRRARHPVLVFTDDDVSVTPGWLGTLVDTLARSGPRAVVTGRVLPAEEGEGGFVPTLKGGEAPAIYQGRVYQDPLVTFNMALRREALEEIGGFDERMGPGTPFPAGEDNELAHRLLEAGFSIVYAPSAVVYHRAWRGADDYVALRWGYGRGQGAFFAKHLSLRDRYVLRRLAGTVVRLAARAPARLLSRRAEPGRLLPRRLLAAGDLAMALGTLSGAAGWLLTQGREGSRRSPSRHTPAGPEPT